MEQQQDLLAPTAVYLKESVAPQAESMDWDSEVLFAALQGLGERSLLGLRVPQQFGGAAVSPETFQTFQLLVARYSGALAFLQTQHQSAVSFIAQSQNQALQQAYLPAMATGRRLVGVGFSHLRRQDDPPLKAIAVDGGYQLQGRVPWVTGWDIFQDFVVAATLPNEQSVFGIVPFQATLQAQGGCLRFSQPMALAAMTATNTVTAELKEWFLPQAQVIDLKSAGWIQANDKRNILRPTPLVLGCARSSLDILATAEQTKSFTFITEALFALQAELTKCHEAILQTQQHSHTSFTEKLALRAWAINLAVRCAHAAVTVSSGAANSIHHAAQRVYRETLVLTVSGQTPEIMRATLAECIRYDP
ncbi:MAG: acyl-CoA/acyl-ACP dehydrogenase [Cyanothece sp. SIO1E1]|nr:acyl-CoA/acyl-ACP dehydrogenase [Cyanothece sp. SIO1E1]